MKDEKKKGLEEIFKDTKVVKVEVNDELKKSFISYAMAVNVSRAIPDVRDGLKPVHRRILYSMGELNLFNDKPYRKSARIVGEVMGKYHPHGDSSVYDALVRLAQDFSIGCPLVDGHGNFGSVDGDSPAAMRYTEARLSKIAGLMLEDIDKNTVDFYPNFDDTLMQPSVLPSKFPNLLVNGADGIAVGMATNIPPHNLAEVISGVQALIANPDIEIDDLIRIIPAPDFPTGGIIMGRAAIKHAYKTGRGGIVVRGKAEIEETESGRHRIIVTELPYQVNKARLIIQMADLVKNKKIEGIADIKEESDRDGMRIVIDLKRDANPQVVLNMLYKHTQLQVSDGIIFLALVDGTPRILNLKEMLYYYLEHQKEVLTRKTQFDLGKALEREHIVKGLVIALANIDEVVQIIKTSSDKQDAVTKLMENFELSDKQANAILEMKLARLTSLEVAKLKEELDELEALIADLNDILAKPQRVLQIINDYLENVKNQFGTPRKTEISMEVGNIDNEDLIEKEDVVISLTHGGYVKRMSVSEYHAQKRGGVGISAHKTKEEDFVERILITSTHSDLLFFTNFGKVYSIRAYEVPEAQRQAKGRAVINLLPLMQDEKVEALLSFEKGQEGNLIIATRNGLIKKTDLKEFASIMKSGKIAIKLVEGDKLINVGLTNGDNEILVASNKGKCIKFNEKNVRPMGRTSQGVRSMKLDSDDYIVDMAILNPDTQLITITENGFGKRTNPEDYRLQTRGGKGIKAGNFNEKTGKLVALKVVNEEEDLMLISDNGVIIRMAAADVRMVGRSSLGVKVMRLRPGAKIVSVATTEHIDDEESPMGTENVGDVSTLSTEDIEYAQQEAPINGESEDEQ
ncbi:MAG: DNA gyrase subunit A [Eubacteriales bacterium]|nr:DNA gyrase subunit A [Eubacteriales bacterium]